MIITGTSAQGAKRMARKKVLVKQLAAIEDFGSMDIHVSPPKCTRPKARSRYLVPLVAKKGLEGPFEVPS